MYVFMLNVNIILINEKSNKPVYCKTFSHNRIVNNLDKHNSLPWNSNQRLFPVITCISPVTKDKQPYSKSPCTYSPNETGIFSEIIWK